MLAGQTPSLSWLRLSSLTTISRKFWFRRNDTIEDTHYLLVELSNYSIPTQINDYFTKMADVGINSVITHPERNPILQETQKRVLQWVTRVAWCR